MNLTKVNNGISIIEDEIAKLKSYLTSNKLEEIYLDEIFKTVEYIISKICEVDEWFSKHSGSFKNTYKKEKNSKRTKNYITVLKFVENERKHGKNFFKIYKKKPGGISMNKITFPLSIPSNSLIWNELDNKLIKPRYKNQLKSYNKYMVNEHVVNTLESSLMFLKNMQETIK